MVQIALGTGSVVLAEQVGSVSWPVRSCSSVRWR